MDNSEYQYKLTCPPYALVLMIVYVIILVLHCPYILLFFWKNAGF